MKTYKDIDAYISAQPKAVQPLLRSLRAAVKQAAPKAKEAIKYGIPTFVGNKNLVHFGAFKSHIGFFPSASGITAFTKEFAAYTTSKGTVQFPYTKRIPLSLVRTVVRFRVREDRVKN